MKIKLLTQNLTVGDQAITGPLDSINTVGDVVNRLTSFLIPLAGIILIFVFIWGGFDFLTSQGSPEKIKSGGAKITAGLIGFILLVLAYFITNLLAKIFGFNGI